jgi:hypothetical protein
VVIGELWLLAPLPLLYCWRPAGSSHAFIDDAAHLPRPTPQLPFVVLKASMDISVGLPATVGIARSFEFDQHARHMCHLVETCFAPIAKVVSLRGADMCTTHPSAFVFCFACCLIGVLLPCHLTYWYELHCRAVWVESRMLVGSHRRLLPAVQPWTVMMYVAASVSLTWVLCSIWALQQ